jgi:hypothetical protein
MVEQNREGLLTEHVHGLRRGWWYAYEGNPHGIELLIPAPMREWQNKVLPASTPCAILGIPEKKSPRALPPPAMEEPAGEDKKPPNDRACPGCEQPVSATARFCESCGGRL